MTRRAGGGDGDWERIEALVRRSRGVRESFAELLDCCGVAIMCTSWPAKHGSPGLGVSNAPLSSPARAAGGISMP